MKRKLLFAFSLVAMLAIGSSIFLGKADIKNYPPKEGPIVAFGDSLVSGIGASKEKDLVSLLSRKIGEPIMNLGVSGNTTAQALARISDVIDAKPRITIVLLGGNDFLRKVPREDTFSNLRQIIEKIQESGSIVVLLGVRGGLLTDSADGLYEDLAQDTGSVYVPNVLAGLFGDQRYMADSIHPNDAGYQIVADKVYKEIKSVLR